MTPETEAQILELFAAMKDDLQAIHFLLHLLNKTNPYKCNCKETIQSNISC